jgi:hypothetical protein
MKKVIIRNFLGTQTHGAEFKDPSAWIADCVANNYWGKGERWILATDAHDPAGVIERESRELSPAVEAVLELVEPAVEAKDAVLDEEGNVVESAIEAREAVYKEVSPAVPAVTEEWVKLRAEYQIEIVDISAEHALQQAIAARKSEYPSAEEFLNAFFDGDDEALEELRQRRLAIKAKYPKE